MMEITTLTPIVVATGLSFCFKNTRSMGIIGVAVMAYFAPVFFLVAGSIGLCAFGYYKLGGKA